MKKKLIVIAIVLLVVVIGVVVVIGLNLDRIVKTAIVTVAPSITKTDVSLDSVSLSLLTGSASLNGLVIGNPPGYKTPFAISVGKAAASLSPMSLLSDKIVVHSVEVRAPEITFEGNPLGNNNLKQLMNNLSGPTDTNLTTKTASGKPAKKLQVDSFIVTGAKIHANITGLGNLTTLAGISTNGLTLTIPDIQLNALGQGPDGITAADLAKTVLNQISAVAIKSVEEYATTNLNSAASGLLNGIKNTNTVNQIKKGLGGLFK
jgi:hypothetical protein